MIEFSDALRLEEYLAPNVEVATNIVNQNSGENCMIGSLATSTLGEQPALPIGANIEGEASQQDNLYTHNNNKSSEYS